LSSKLSVGIHILTVLALKRGETLTSEMLACSVNTNPVVIRRLLGLFREAGFVDSKKGVGGGWVLLTDPERITLLDVLEAVEPQCETFDLHRSEPNQECPVGHHIQDVLSDVYAEVKEGIARRLSLSTIADVADLLEVRMRAEGSALDHAHQSPTLPSG
jgi:Rrf2 family protein